jgi:hypothetical protein
MHNSSEIKINASGRLSLLPSFFRGLALTLFIGSAVSAQTSDVSESAGSKGDRKQEISLGRGKAEYRLARCDAQKGLNFDSTTFQKFIGFDGLAVALAEGSVINGEKVILKGQARGALCDNIGFENKEFVWRYKAMDPEVYHVKIEYRPSHPRSKVIKNSIDGWFTIEIAAEDFFTPNDLENIRRGEGIENVEFTVAFGVRRTKKYDDSLSFFDRVFLVPPPALLNKVFRRNYKARVLPTSNGVAHFSIQY